MFDQLKQSMINSARRTQLLNAFTFVLAFFCAVELPAAKVQNWIGNDDPGFISSWVYDEAEKQ